MQGVHMQSVNNGMYMLGTQDQRLVFEHAPNDRDCRAAI